MRTRAALAACVTVWVAVFGASARAQEAPVSGTRTCVDVRVGDQSSYGCINEAFRRLAERPRAPAVTGTLDATSPAPAVGTFNRTATAERMGDTFGHSAFSQRPAPPVYVNPLTRH